MAEPHAEVIGDPIAHSLSPAIHQHWLQAIGTAGSFRATRCTVAELPNFLAERRADPHWRGCSVTMPLKRVAAALADRASSDLASNAANCLVPTGDELVAHNADIAGVRAAIAGLAVNGRPVAIIGAGGAAAAAAAALAEANVRSIRRDPLSGTIPAEAAHSLAGAALVVNATPLGMAGSPAMPAHILAALRDTAPDAAAFDMVYQPLDTPFLEAARAQGMQVIDGLTMLIGQARGAFTLFFGVEPPAGDAELRRLLLRAG